jgi:hypothetical protein
MLFVCTFAYHFKAVLIIGHILSILISDLIAPVIVPFSVDYPKAVLVVGDQLAVDHNHLMALLVVFVVLSILVDLHPVAVLIVLYRIVVGIVLN